MATAKSPQHNSGREKLQQAYHLAGEAALDTAENLRTRAKTSVKSNQKRATDVAEKAESSIRKHPTLSVGCAFAAGWLIAKMLK